MPGIHLESLAGYTRDKRSEKAFFGPYAYIQVPALLGFVGIIIGGFRGVIHFNFGWWCALILCWIACMGTMVHAYRSTPRSLRTGESMQRYRNLSAPDGVWEVIYVDEVSKTYFRRVYLQPATD